MKKTLTVGDVRRALEGQPDDLPVWVAAEAFNGDDLDTLHASVTEVKFAEAGRGGFFSGPPVDRLVIYADGVPDGVCKDCGKQDGKHRSFCGVDEAEE